MRVNQRNLHIILKFLRRSRRNWMRVKQRNLHIILKFLRKSQRILMSQPMMNLLRRKRTTISGIVVDILEVPAPGSAVIIGGMPIVITGIVYVVGVNVHGMGDVCGGVR